MLKVIKVHHINSVRKQKKCLDNTDVQGRK